MSYPGTRSNRASPQFVAPQFRKTGRKEWEDTLRTIDENADLIADQLYQAGPQFPDLVTSYGLLLAYVGYLHNQLRGTTAPPQVPPFLDQLCERNGLVCECLNGSERACRILNPPYEDLPAPSRDCDTLWRQYLEALDREREALLEVIRSGDPGLWDPSPRPLLQTVRESQRLWERYRAMCLGLISLP